MADVTSAAVPTARARSPTLTTARSGGTAIVSPSQRSGVAESLTTCLERCPSVTS